MKKRYLPKALFCCFCGDLTPLEDLEDYYTHAQGFTINRVCIPCTPDARKRDRWWWEGGSHPDREFLSYLNTFISEGEDIKVLFLLNGESPHSNPRGRAKEWWNNVRNVNFNKYKKQYYDMHGIEYVEHDGIILRDLVELNSKVVKQQINKLVEEELERRREEKRKKSEKQKEKRNWRKDVLRTKGCKMTYLMKDKTKPGIYKIGKSYNADHRENTLQSETPYAVNVKVWKEDIEDILHNHYDEYRVRGEWFELTPIQVRYICTNDWTKYLNGH